MVLATALWVCLEDFVSPMTGACTSTMQRNLSTIYIFLEQKHDAIPRLEQE
jgi:hypothetical protein